MHLQKTNDAQRECRRVANRQKRNRIQIRCEKRRTTMMIRYRNLHTAIETVTSTKLEQLASARPDLAAHWFDGNSLAPY